MAMKVFLRNIGVTFILMSVICVVFHKIGWLANWREVISMYFIAFVVIFANKIIDILISKIRSR